MSSPPSLLGTILGCVILAFATWPVHGGFMVFLAVPFLVLWLPYSAFLSIWSKPARRRLQAIKVCLWLAVVAGGYSLHWYYRIAARAAADEVIQVVLAYKEKTGSYPKRLEDAGVALGQGGRLPWRISYFETEQKTHWLIYPNTFIVFQVYIYKFEQGRWDYDAA